MRLWSVFFLLPVLLKAMVAAAANADVKSPTIEDVVRDRSAMVNRVKQMFSEVVNYMDQEVDRLDRLRKDIRIEFGYEQGEEQR